MQQQVFGPNDTVSLKNKNAKYTTAQQQQKIHKSIKLWIERGNQKRVSSYKIVCKMFVQDFPKTNSLII